LPDGSVALRHGKVNQRGRKSLMENKEQKSERRNWKYRDIINTWSSIQVHKKNRVLMRSIREFKQITTAGATMAAVTEKVW